MIISRRKFLACLGAVSAETFAKTVRPDPAVVYFNGAAESPSVQVLAPEEHPVRPIQLEGVVDYLRLLKQPPSRENTQQIEKLSQDLYSALWKPIEDSRVDQTEVRIKATGILRNFPFESLKQPPNPMRATPEFVGRTSKIRYVTGHCRSRPSARWGATHAGENFIYAPMARNGMDLPRLAAAIREARLVAQLTGGHLRIGPDASKERLQEDAATPFAVLHLATHCTANADNAVCIALRRDKNVELLTSTEIRSLSIAGRLVVLSACSSIGQTERQDEVDLGQSFLNAGADEVIAARWDVDDEAGYAFMRSFYQHLRRGRDSGSALRYARASMITSAVLPYNNPYFWSNFMSLIRG